MSLRRRRHQHGEKPKASVDMTSLIDLTFLLLVTFIVTLPALEQGISIMLPQAKTDVLPTKDSKANVISVAYPTGLFLNDKPTTLEELEALAVVLAVEVTLAVAIKDVVKEHIQITEKLELKYLRGNNSIIVIGMEEAILKDLLEIITQINW